MSPESTPRDNPFIEPAARLREALAERALSDFGDLVRNAGKQGSSSIPPRERGFVCVVRRAQSLELLQKACQEVEDGIFCATLRYSVKGGSVFGSLLRAAIGDLAVIHERTGTELLGDAVPEPADPRWMLPLDSPLGRLVSAWETDERGSFDSEQIQGFIRLLSETEVLSQGMRLILFAEVVGADGSATAVEEWQHASEMMFRILPERVGLVLSGAPQGFVLPEDPAHFLELPELPGGAPAADASGPSAARFEASELVPDVPSSEDHLEREAYASSLATFLLHPNTAPPITIGLYGRWGTGKSSFFKLLERKMVGMAAARSILSDMPEWQLRLKSWATRLRRADGTELFVYASSRLHARVPTRWLAERRILTVGFNAWQYEDAKQTWAGLASAISERLEAALPWHRRQWMRVKYAWKQHRSDLLLNFGLPVMLLALAAVVLLPWLTPERVTALAPSEAPNQSALPALLKAVLPAGSLLLLVWTVGWRLMEVLKPVSERVAGYVRRQDYRADMGYQHKVIADLKFLLAEVKACREDMRVLVYIDDLDRCSDEKIVEILRATVLILADCNLFVMFGMDTEMIRRAIVAHYEKMQVKLADPGEFASAYLRKIVQIALYLPQPRPERRFSLVESMFSDQARQAFAKRAPETDAQAPAQAPASVAGGLPYDLSSIRPLVTVQTVEDTADELAALSELQAYLPDNARELKRFINTHRFLKILLSAQGTSWSGRKQQALVKWLLFCGGWRPLVDDVVRRAHAEPEDPDCLRSASAAGEWDERACAFAALGVPISSRDVVGEFERAARLSQYVQDTPAPRAAEKKPSGPGGAEQIPVPQLVG